MSTFDEVTHTKTVVPKGIVAAAENVMATGPHRLVRARLVYAAGGGAPSVRQPGRLRAMRLRYAAW